MNLRRYALALTASLLFSGCETIFGQGDAAGRMVPDHPVRIHAGCGACLPAEATHPCPPPGGGVICSGIPTARVGDTMLLCAIGRTSAGALGRIEWSSSDAQVAAVTPARLTGTHCVNELSNAFFEARAPGTVSIIVNELDGGRVLSTLAASVTVLPAIQ